MGNTKIGLLQKSLTVYQMMINTSVFLQYIIDLSIISFHSIIYKINCGLIYTENPHTTEQKNEVSYNCVYLRTTICESKKTLYVIKQFLKLYLPLICNNFRIVASKEIKYTECSVTETAQ